MKVINRTVLEDGRVREELVYKQGNRERMIIFIKSASGEDRVREAMQVVLKDRYVLKE